jgi:flagellar biosynthesis GTPase FlhF
MTTVNVTHVKGCVEDLELGEGTVQQIRNGRLVTLTKFGAASIPWSIDPVTGAPISIRARVEALEFNLVTSVAAAAQSETNAAQSETNAAQSETNAAQSETNAAQSKAAALASQNAAAQSETSAAQSKAAALASQNAAAQSETNAAQSKAAALASQNAAAQSETNAAQSEMLAQDWAVKLVNEVAPGEGYSAKYWAQQAADIVTDGIIDDSVTNQVKTWSGSKISTSLEAKADKDVIFYANSKTVTNSVTIQAGQNAMSIGPELSFVPSAVITVEDGAVWTII